MDDAAFPTRHTYYLWSRLVNVEGKQ